MKLTAVEISGFKSFASPTRLEFGESITGIVGPNGSGKSNCADAIRWVLGEQSMKTLRGKKSEDVIFAGGPSRSRVGMASVSLMLTRDDSEQEDDKETHPLLAAPEIVITRQLTRAGDSIYLINKKAVRLSDVAEVLIAAGFGQKTYTVIGQGMADAFVNASPAERRTMFEDATGVTPLLRRKEQAERRLDQTREHLDRARDVLQELIPRLSSLKRQASRARQHETIEAELSTYEQQWYVFHWSNAQARYKASVQEQEQIQKKIAELSKKLDLKDDPSESIANDTRRLSDLRREYEDLRSREQEIAVAMARVEGDGTWDTELLEEEKHAKNAARKKLLTQIDEQHDILAHYKADLKKQRITLKQANPSTIKHRLSHLVDLQDAFIDQIRGVRTMNDVTDIKGQAEQIRTYTMDTVGMFNRDEDGKNMRQTLHACDRIAEQITKTRVAIATHTAESQAIEERIAEIDRILKTGAVKEIHSSAPELDEIHKKRESITKETDALEKRLLETNKAQRETEKEREHIRQELHVVEQELHQHELNAARETARIEDLQREMIEYRGKEFLASLPNLTKNIPSEIPENAEQKIWQLRKKKASIGTIDTSVLKEEEEVSTRVQELQGQIDDLEQAGKSLRDGLRELDRQINEQFTSGMHAMDDAFSSAFRQVFGGGRAGLSVTKPRRIEHALPDTPVNVDSLPSELSDLPPAEEGAHEHELPAGVEIRANPPGKKLSSLSQLSGGEKALTSIALLFAIISQRPSPFIVFDEVDATLDEENSRRFADLLRTFSGDTQFIIITHNRSTMEAAELLWGVTMKQDGTSHVLSIRLSEATATTSAPASNAVPQV